MSDTKTWREWAANGDVAFWDCDDNQEVLRFEELTEAVEHYVDGELFPGCDTEAIVREKFPEGLTVFGWERKEVDQRWRAAVAESMAERFAEEFEEEYGGSDSAPAFDENAQDELAAKLLLLVEQLVLTPWQCEQAAKVELSLDELLAMLRELNPSWFERAGGAA